MVRPLVQVLASLGLRVWYDEDMIRGGDSIREAIDRGLKDTRHALVVLSPSFLSKRWTKWELNALVQRFNQPKRQPRGRLIPLWHHVSEDQVRKFSPPLADIAALQSGDGIDTVSLRIRDLVIPRSRIPRKNVRAKKIDHRIIEQTATAFLGFLRAVLKSESLTLSVYLVGDAANTLWLVYPKSSDAPSFEIPVSKPRRGLTEWLAKSKEESGGSFADRFTQWEAPRAMIAAPIRTADGDMPAGTFSITSIEPGLFEREKAFLVKTFVPMAMLVFAAILGAGDDKGA